MMRRAAILSAGRTIAVGSEDTLLAAALAAGIAYPHGCRSGRCGACKTRLLEGDVTLLPHTPFSLTETEKAQGLILACRARLGSDVTVRWLAQPAVAHTVACTGASVVSTEPLTHDIVALRLKPDSAFEVSPGQYARLRFPGLPARDYSFAPSAKAGEIAFHVRIVPGGAVSPVVAAIAGPGLRLEVQGPYGDAYLREDHAGPILCAAGGSGLAPILSIVERAVTSGMYQPIHVYFGARDVADVYGTEHLARLAERHPRLISHCVLSSPSSPNPYRSGFVHDAIAGDLTGSQRGWKAYVAGPPAMVEAVGALCRERGIRESDFHADPFFTPAELVDTPAGAGR